MLDRSRRVVLLVDYDNLQICASRDTPGRELQLVPVVQLAQRYGTVIEARAYAEWNLSTERLAVYKAGLEPAFAPVLRTESDRSGKSLADTVMVADGMDMLWTLSPDVLVLATSDKDLIPLVRVAKQRGAHVVVLGSDFTAVPLREMADEHITYRQLITDGPARATEAGPARQPAALPEPGRRRAREREVRPQPAAAAPAQPSQPAAAAPPQPSQPAPAAEPVAPVGTGEGEGQISSRRRRRRGSRRRAERLSGTSEAGTAAPADGVVTESAPISALESGPPPVELTPTPGVEPETPTPSPPVRRRRSRRAPTAQPAESEAPVSEPTEAPLEAPQAAAQDGLPLEGAEVAEPSETATPARRARPRRVASAARGRSRPAPRS
jgi:uncharacterized LabA/DUF88 family protein